ncbi:hypothetical protein [Neobacillus sp. FSL H8-0543]|uniref:hypothetical protein n=1 Tax=Neobacillus sp. FSL H8-0543 TaxID=2954672 RepID=UPI003158BC4F
MLTVILSPAAVAYALRVSPETIRRAIREGELKAEYSPQGYHLKLEDVQEFSAEKGVDLNLDDLKVYNNLPNKTIAGQSYSSNRKNTSKLRKKTSLSKDKKDSVVTSIQNNPGVMIGTLLGTELARLSTKLQLDLKNPNVIVSLGDFIGSTLSQMLKILKDGEITSEDNNNSSPFLIVANTVTRFTHEAADPSKISHEELIECTTKALNQALRNLYYKGNTS